MLLRFYYYYYYHFINCDRQYSCSIILSCTVPPSIDDANIVARPEVISNQNVRLTCPATGIPRPTITWHKNKEPITVSDARHVLLDDGWTLELRNTNPEDTARYTCRATNVAGQNEKVFDLQVLSKSSQTHLYTHLKITSHSTTNLLGFLLHKMKNFSNFSMVKHM